MTGKGWKARVRSLIATRAGRGALRCGELLDPRSPHHLRILTYHCIENAEGFSQQVEHLRERWRCVSEERVIEAILQGAALPPRSVWITFDDADRNFDEVAWPILRAAGLPVTLFVPSGYPDHPERVLWWDRLAAALARTRLSRVTVDGDTLPLAEPTDRARALRHWKRAAHAIDPVDLDRWSRAIEGALEVEPATGRTMTWERIAAIAREGVSIGAHTVTHPFLDRLDPPELAAEVNDSVATIASRLGRSPRTFAYPNGRYSPAVVETVAGSGVALAATTERGTNDLRACDPLRLRRINIGPDADLPTLRASLLRATPLRRAATALPPAEGGPRSLYSRQSPLMP